jgi:hypothetical protein
VRSLDAALTARWCVSTRSSPACCSSVGRSRSALLPEPLDGAGCHLRDVDDLKSLLS